MPFVHGALESNRLNKKTLNFLLPSALGVLVFLIPVPWDGKLTIVIGIVTDWVKVLMGDYGLHIVVGIVVTTSILTVLGTTFRMDWML